MEAESQSQPAKKACVPGKKRVNRWGYVRKSHLKLLEGPLLSRVWPANRVVVGMRVAKWVREHLVDHTELVVLEHCSCSTSTNTSPKDSSGLTCSSIYSDISRFRHKGIEIELMARACQPMFVAQLLSGMSSVVGEGRGNLIVRLDIADCKATNVTFLCTVLRGCSSLRVLNLSNNAMGAEGVGKLAGELGCGVFPRLQQLNLSENRIGAAGAGRLCAALTACSALTSLDLSCNAFGSQGLFSDPPLHFFQHVNGKSASLAHLDLSRNHLTSEILAFLCSGLIQHCAALKSLVLSRNCILGEGVGYLGSALEGCSALTLLDLSWNSLFVDGAAKLAAALCTCPRVATLDLSHSCINADGASLLSAVLPDCPRLEHLDLSWNSIGAEGAAHLALAMSDCPALRRLLLCGNNLCPDGAESMASMLGSVSTLTRLDVSRNALAPEGAAYLCSVLADLPLLASLNLSENHVGPEGAGAVARAMVRCKKLRELQLQDNSLAARGAGRIAAGLGQCKVLERLDLSKNQIGNKGMCRLARVLRQCKQLVRLTVAYNGIGDQGAASLVVTAARA